jgi:hypothetical protein
LLSILAERRYWVTGDGRTNTILVIERRCLDIRELFLRTV